MWAFIFLFMIVAFIAATIYLITRVRKFAWVDRLAGAILHKKPNLSILISVLTCAAFIGALSFLLGYINAIIITLYLILFWLASEFVFWAAGKIRKKNWKRYYAEAAAILVTLVYMSWGWYQAHGVWKKEYTIETDKKVENLKIALIADSHTGTTFDGDGFLAHVKAIQAESPDAVLIAGDFVDDDTSLSDMKKCCAALGTFDTKYGVYYVFGNHDKGYYSPERRGYDGDDLVAELSRNGVTVLQDETVQIGDSYYITGRQDLSEVTDRGGSRADISDLTKKLDDSRFDIVMDHQPADYANEKAARVDLVLSGHTHGGQLLLMKLFQEITGVGGNDQIYGLEDIDGSDFLVTSGISDWAIKFKTGCRSEYVIINIQSKK